MSTERYTLILTWITINNIYLKIKNNIYFKIKKHSLGSKKKTKHIVVAAMCATLGKIIKPYNKMDQNF